MVSIPRATIYAIGLMLFVGFSMSDAIAADQWYYEDAEICAPVIVRSKMTNPQFTQLDLREGFYDRSTFTGTQFKDCTFSQIQVTDCKAYKPSIARLSVQYPEWTDGIISDGRLSRVDLHDIRLTDCDIDNVSYESAQVVDLRMYYCTGRNWEFDRLEIRDLRAEYTDFPYGRWDYCEFNGSQFTRPDFSYSRFESGDFARSTIRYCDLSNVSIENCNIRGLTINGVNIEELMRNAGR